ncbi:hypothetical protein [Brunnivagina elsteri]|uniref:Uncharacterized protein n=1 Tax=Brunnivagina elsteri CCALA 953 TaxID=987040 RepID=A0A2A2TPR0_9CYAN|nr:hypothetical protein [Calothrix elsteri]PAX60415.1 hypothetical protein CK510_01955 [Calothrix elsteri CCALA 953]
MNKQKLTLGFGLMTVLLSGLVATAPVFAGSGAAKGTGTGSGSFIGTPIVPGSNLSVGRNGIIIAPPGIQLQVNNIARGIIARQAPINSPLNIIIIILRGGTSANTPATQVQTALVNVRVSPALAQALIKSLTAMFGSKVSATSGVAVAQLEVSPLVASNKGLAVSKIAQGGEKADVNISQLNASINAYNQIILESSPETLRELAKNEEFVAIGSVLKELRQALNK